MAQPDRLPYPCLHRSATWIRGGPAGPNKMQLLAPLLVCFAFIQWTLLHAVLMSILISALQTLYAPVPSHMRLRLPE